MLPTATRPDHAPEDAAPTPRSTGGERIRFGTLTAGSLVLAGGIVLAVSGALPFLAGWVLPTVLVALTGAFLVLGRMAAVVGSTAASRAWAGWAGATSTLAIAGLVNLAGLGGALVALLLVVIAANAAIALWFRSPVHFAVVQVLGLVWGALAHVFGITPVAALVTAAAGLWWLRVVGVRGVIVVTTTITLPVAVALLLHPLTHSGGAVDGADVAVLTGSVAVSLTWMSVIGRARPVSTVWSTARATTVVVLVAQVLAGAVPAVETFLVPAAPWPSVLLAAAAVLVAATVVALRPTRRGVVTVLVLCALQLGEIAAVLLAGPLAGTTVGLGGLLVLAVVLLVRGADGAPARGSLWLAVLVLPVLWVVLVGLPPVAAAGVLIATGAAVAVAQTRPVHVGAAR